MPPDEFVKRWRDSPVNERPQWLADAQTALDAAVAAAYGWPSDVSDDDLHSSLFDLNQSQSHAGKARWIAAGRYRALSHDLGRFKTAGCVR
jgi:anti-sigma factor RsiW